MIVRLGHTTRAADGNRSSLGSWPLLQNAQAMSMAITTVLPEPVAILQPRRVRAGSASSGGLPDGKAGASTSFARSSSVNRGVNDVRLPPIRISARYMTVSTASVWQKNSLRGLSSPCQWRSSLRVTLVAFR